MQIFISYAHTRADEPLALYIAARLRSAGFDIWMDKYSLNAGQLTREAIQEGAAQSDHAVFVVSPSWLARDWTDWELELFAARDPRVVQRIPIRRQPHLLLPPRLHRATGFDWLEDDGDGDARFWELYCALRNQPKGDPAEWTARGRDVGAGTKAPDWQPPRAARSGRPSLKCDRAPQWKTVDDLATSGGNELILVPGASGQDHEHFIQRVEQLFRPDPPRSIAKVGWDQRPAGRDAYYEALATALRVPVSGCAAALGDRLSHTNLVLIHPCVGACFADEYLLQYYTEWLPEWLAAARPRMNLKCIQPIEWPNETLMSTILRWLPGRADIEDDQRPMAEQMIRTLLTSAKPVLRAVRLNELHNVSNAELDEFCSVIALTPKQSEWLIARIHSRGAKTSHDVFHAIDTYLPDARSIT